MVSIYVRVKEGAAIAVTLKKRFKGEQYEGMRISWANNQKILTITSEEHTEEELRTAFIHSLDTMEKQRTSLKGELRYKFVEEEDVHLKNKKNGKATEVHEQDPEKVTGETQYIIDKLKGDYAKLTEEVSALEELLDIADTERDEAIASAKKVEQAKAELQEQYDAIRAGQGGIEVKLQTQPTKLEHRYFHYLPADLVTQGVEKAYEILKEAKKTAAIVKPSEEEKRKYLNAKIALENINNPFITVNEDELRKIIAEYESKEAGSQSKYTEEEIAKAEETWVEYKLHVSVIYDGQERQAILPIGQSELHKDLIKIADNIFGDGKDAGKYRNYRCLEQSDIDYLKQEFQKETGLKLRLVVKNITETSQEL